MIISERIFRILQEKGISQKTFSEKTGIAQSTISDWKRKKTNPASDKIMVICRVLGISVYELLEDSDEGANGPEDYGVLWENSAEHMLLESYRSLGASDQAKILGYLDALKDKIK